MERSAPLVFKTWAWSKERFPPINIFSGFLLFGLVFAILQNSFSNTLQFSMNYIFIGFGICLQFLVLRILDEHKDFEEDLIAHPKRVLQQGLISLQLLRNMGFVAFLGTFFISVFFYSIESIVTWLAMTLWTGLMTKEFFVRNWLRKNLLVYSVSHMFVIVLMIIWASSLIYPKAYLSPSLPGLLFIIFLNGLIYEITRKVKGQEEEIQNVASFSRNWGIRNSSFVIASLVFLSFLFVIIFTKFFFNPKFIYFTPILIGYFLTCGSIRKFITHPIAKNRKANEATGALFVLVSYLSIIAFAL